MSWEDTYDKWKTTEPEDSDSHLVCDECKNMIYPGEDYYDIGGIVLCEDCAKDWLDNQKHEATWEQCYGDTRF